MWVAYSYISHENYKIDILVSIIISLSPCKSHVDMNSTLLIVSELSPYRLEGIFQFQNHVQLMEPILENSPICGRNYLGAKYMAKKAHVS